MKKRLLLIALCCALCLGFVFTQVLQGSGMTAKAVSLEPVSATDAKIDVKGKSAYLMDYNTGTVLYAQNEDARQPIASVVKVMTMLLCYEDIDSGKLKLDDQITISPNASSMGGSQAFLDAGSVYSAETLLKSITVASANDSCVAMAEHLNGSVESFVARMNEKAKILGMNNTNFANCTGLPAANHYSSAKDVAIMMQNLLKHQHYFHISQIWMEDLVHQGGRITGLANTNKLLRSYKGCDGGKTGFTNEAMFCMSATAKRGEMRLIAVVLGSSDSKTRFASCANMFNYGFANFENTLVLDAETKLDPMVVSNGKQKTVDVKLERNSYMFSAKAAKPGVEVVYEFEDLKAPLSNGQVVGKAIIMKNGTSFDQVNIVSTSAVLKRTFGDIFEYVIQRF